MGLATPGANEGFTSPFVGIISTRVSVTGHLIERTEFLLYVQNTSRGLFVCLFTLTARALFAVYVQTTSRVAFPAYVQAPRFVEHSAIPKFKAAQAKW